MSDVGHCILCGNLEEEVMRCPREELTTMIAERARPGPIAYEAAMTWKGACIPACRACVHQLRRHRPGGRAKPMLPLDMSILQMVVPGVMRQQDQRTTARMRSALTRAGNLYYRFYEALGPLLASEDRLGSWWAYNLRTEYFAHKASARLMRLSGLSTPGTGSTSSTPSAACCGVKAASATPSRA